uniref:Uncharacterized protein n=1 Tax=Ciona intestinalis TaxID=7719 RepID=F7BCA2_CIOIN
MNKSALILLLLIGLLVLTEPTVGLFGRRRRRCWRRRRRYGDEQAMKDRHGVPRNGRRRYWVKQLIS